MNDSVKRGLLAYAIAGEEYRIAHNGRVAFDATMDAARSVARLEPTQAAKHVARVGLLTARAALSAVSLVALKRAQASLPPEPKVTREVVVVEDAPQDTWWEANKPGGGGWVN